MTIATIHSKEDNAPMEHNKHSNILNWHVNLINKNKCPPYGFITHFSLTHTSVKQFGKTLKSHLVASTDLFVWAREWFPETGPDLVSLAERKVRPYELSGSAVWRWGARDLGVEWAQRWTRARAGKQMAHCTWSCPTGTCNTRRANRSTTESHWIVDYQLRLQCLPIYIPH